MAQLVAVQAFAKRVGARRIYARRAARIPATWCTSGAACKLLLKGPIGKHPRGLAQTCAIVAADGEGGV